MRKTLKTLAGGSIAAIVPALLMAASAPQRSVHAIVDHAVVVAAKTCSRSYCDATPGICESVQGYHLSKQTRTDIRSMQVAEEINPLTQAVVTH